MEEGKNISLSTTKYNSLNSLVEEEWLNIIYVFIGQIFFYIN